MSEAGGKFFLLAYSAPAELQTCVWIPNPQFHFITLGVIHIWLFQSQTNSVNTSVVVNFSTQE